MVVGDRGRVAALLAAGVLALGACGGGGDDEGPEEDAGAPADEATEEATDAGSEAAGPAPAQVSADALSSGPDALAGAGTYAFAMQMTYTGLAGLAGAPDTMPDEATIDVLGGADASGRSSLEMDVTEMFRMMGGGQGDAAGSEGATIRTVLDGDTAYVDYGELGGSFGLEAGQWLQLGADQLAQTVGSVSGPGGPSPTNPGAFTDLLRGITDDVTVVGEEDVRGTATTHVSAMADLAAAVSATPADRQAGLQQQFAGLGLEQVPLDVWLAGDGLPRRVEIVAEPGQVPSLNGAGLRIVFETFDHGQQVEIEVPSGDAVVDGSALVAPAPPPTPAPAPAPAG